VEKKRNKAKTQGFALPGTCKGGLTRSNCIEASTDLSPPPRPQWRHMANTRLFVAPSWHGRRADWRRQNGPFPKFWTVGKFFFLVKKFSYKKIKFAATNFGEH